MGMSGGRLRGLAVIPMVVALIFGTMTVAGAPAGAASSWSIASSPSPFRPDGLQLSAVSCADATTCFAVGSRLKDYILDYMAGIVIERWNGSTWSTVVGPVAGGNLSAVSCPTATRCFAVGRQVSGTLIDQWDGASWSTVASPNPAGTQIELNGVSCWSVNRCIAVGDRRSGSTTKTLVERWDGVAWHIDASPNPTGAISASLDAVFCPNVTSCFAVGRHNEEDDYTGGTLHYRGGALLEHWNGTAWKIQPSPTPKWHAPSSDGLLSTPLLDGIACPAPRSCTAVGYTPTDALVERWNGTKWSLVATPHPAPQRNLPRIAELRAVDCAATTDCMAVGVSFVPIDYRDGAPAANSIAEHWDGKAWTIVARPTMVPTTRNYFFKGQLSELSGVSCPAVNQCAAVGNSAMAKRWDGAKWSLAPLAASTSFSSLSSVACPAATRCFAVGSAVPLLAGSSKPLIERWDGSTWSVMPSAGIPGTDVDAFLTSISCLTPTDCTAVGAYVTGSSSRQLALIEHWNGAKWARVASPSPSNSKSDAYLAGVACTSATDCKAVGVYSTSDAQHGYVDHPLAEHWNGTKWSIVALPGSGQTFVGGISCASATSCFAVGALPNASPLLDRWDGARWTAMANPKPAAGTAYTLEAVSCPSTTDCTAVGVRYTSGTAAVATLIEHWDGTSWSITPSPTPTNASLEMTGVSCTTATSCTAVGAINKSAYAPPRPSTPAAPVIEEWDGNAWSIVSAPATPPPITGSSLFGVSCRVDIGCTAVGIGHGGIYDMHTLFTDNAYTLVERGV